MWNDARNCMQNHPLHWKILGVGCALTGAYYLKTKLGDYQERRALTVKRERRQKERAAEIRRYEKNFLPLTEKSLRIVELPFEKLQEKLQSRELSAVDVLKAYTGKALSLSLAFNCVTQFVPQAWEWAEELDRLPKVKGPLHGIPFGIKEDHDIVGMDTTLGLSINLEKPASKNAVVVQILQDAGGIPFCKTNLPQTVFSPTSDNPIYGRTVNHLNTKLSTGGSSGGSGCLVGAGGAPFAFGTDIGGSLRIPSHMSGITTLRPTIGRISGKGITQCIEGSAGYVGVTGVMAQRASTLATVFQTYTANSVQNQYDPLALPIPWDENLFSSKTPLKIGYYTSLPHFPTLGDTPETVMKAKSALEKLGHTVVAIELPDTFHIMDIFIALASADGGNQNYNKMKYDEVAVVVQKFMEGRTFFSAWWGVLKRFFSRQSTREFAAVPPTLRSEVLWDYLKEQIRIKYDILERMAKANVDLILAPAYPFPACRIDDAEPLIKAIVYTCTWNLADFPAGVVPFGTESCQKIANYDDQNDFYLKLAKDSIRHSKGMPIGVQIIGKPYKEEMVLRVLKELDDYKLSQKGQ